MLEQHLVLFNTSLRWFYKTWSRPRVDKLLHLLIASLSSVLENKGHSTCWHEGISLRSCESIDLSKAELYDWYRACHRSFNLLHGRLLNLMVSMAGSLYFLTQFIKFHGLLLDVVISWILLSKNTLLAILTVFLYLFQLVKLLDFWYVAKSLLNSSFYYALDLLVMLMNFENLFQRFSVIKVNSWVMYLSILHLVTLEVTIKPILHLSLLTNSFSSSLFLTIDHFFSWINSFSTIMDTNKKVWSNGHLRFGDIVWLLNSSDSVLRNIRFSTEFESWELSEYHMSTRVIDVNSSRPKLSATS